MTPVIEDAVERPVEADLGHPADLVADPRRIAGEHRHVVRPQPRRIDAYRHLHPRLRDQPFEDLADRAGLPRADVVGAAGRPTLADRLIGAYGVGDMRRLASRLEIADDDLGLAAPALDLGDLLRESGGGKRRILPRTDVIERPSDPDVNAVGDGAEREPFLRELAQPVGIRWLDGRVLGNRSEEHTSELQSHSDLVCRLL